jgi:hypothetical protein
MTTEISADPDLCAGRGFETKMGIETRYSMDFEKRQLQALGQLVKRLPRQIAMMVLQLLELFDQHRALVRVINCRPEMRQGRSVAMPYPAVSRHVMTTLLQFG